MGVFVSDSETLKFKEICDWDVSAMYFSYIQQLLSCICASFQHSQIHECITPALRPSVFTHLSFKSSTTLLALLQQQERRSDETSHYLLPGDCYATHLMFLQLML